MKITKAIAMEEIRQAFVGFRVDFIEDDSIAIRTRVFFDEHGIAWLNLPTIPRIGYQTTERLDKSIKEIKVIFDQEYTSYLKS